MGSKQEHSNRLFEFGECWLSHHPNSVNYHICWYDARKRRNRRKTTGTSELEGAKLELIGFAQKRQDQRAGPRGPEEVSVHEAINYYLDKHLVKESSTRKTAIYALRVIDSFMDHMGVTWIADLTHDVMDEFGPWRQANNKYTRKGIGNKLISDGTLARELNVLASALNFYRDRGRVKWVPKIKLPSQPPSRERWLTPQQVQHLLAASRTQLQRDYIMLALHTLQRPKYLYELKVEQVDLDKRVIDFRNPNEPMNRKRRPVIRISETLVPILERLIRSSQSGYVLEHNGRRIATTLLKCFKMACEDAGLPDDVVLYTLRHTGATWLAQRGVPLREIAGMMGHSMQKTTERYAKHHPDYMTSATAVLDEVLPVVDVARQMRASDFAASRPHGKAAVVQIASRRPDRLINSQGRAAGGSF